jgi:hypothetical protein
MRRAASGIIDQGCTGELDSVVAAQGVLGGEVAGVAGERFVDRDERM